MIITEEERNNLFDFKTYVLDGLRMVYKVESKKNGSYLIHTAKFGVIEMYPKANKLLFRNSDRWLNGAMEWLCNNL